MSDKPLHIFAVVGSLHEKSVTRVAVNHLVEQFRAAGCSVDMLDLQVETLPLLNTDTAFTAAYYAPLRARVVAADAFILGTPDYHGSISSPLKNFFQRYKNHSWKSRILYSIFVVRKYRTKYFAFYYFFIVNILFNFKKKIIKCETILFFIITYGVYFIFINYEVGDAKQ